MESWKQSSAFMQLPGMKRRATEPSDKKEKHLPLVGYLPNRVRNHFIAMVGEFCGTFLFLFFAFCGTQVANQAAVQNNPVTADGDTATLPQGPNAPILLYIALSFGFSLAVNVWVFFRVSGGLFNPAVTLGLALIGAISWVRAVCNVVAEMLAGICAAAVVAALLPGPLSVSTSLGGTTSVTRGLFIEMFLTAELMFTILMLAAEKHKGTFLAPIGIGLALFVAELGGVYFTGGSLNPARSFGPCVALASFPHEHWIYWLGPFLGTIVAVGFYRFVKLLEYETANPGADFNEKEAEVFQFDEENAASAKDVERPNVAVGQPDYTADSMGVRPSTSQSGGQIPGSGGRVDGSRGNSRDLNSRANSRGHDQMYIPRDAYQEAPRVEQGIPHTEQGDLHPGLSQQR